MTCDVTRETGFTGGVQSPIAENEPRRRLVPMRLLAGIAALALAGSACGGSHDTSVSTPDRPAQTSYPAHHQTTPVIAAETTPRISSTQVVPAHPNARPSVPNEDFRVAQTFIVGFDASTPKSVIESVVAQTHIGGIYLTGTTDTVATGFTPAFYHHLSELAGAPMIVAMDDEGGEVDRNAGTELPSAWQMGRLSAGTVQNLAEHAGKVMRADGVNVDLAPVDDLDNGRRDGAISKYFRSFGGSPRNIAAKAGAFVAGLQAEGITAVLKHFPGIGYASPDSDTDSHKAFSPPLSTLEQRDLIPYKLEFQDEKIKVVMLSNEYVNGLDSSEPASISPKVVSYLRRMGFPGIITTDALTSIAGYDGMSLSQNVVAAVRAGVNMPLFGFTSTAAIKHAIRDTVSTVSQSQLNHSYKEVLSLRNRQS